MEPDEEHFAWCLRVMCERRDAFLRSDVGRHLLQSRLELLKAVRAAIDKKIDMLEDFGQSAEPKKVDIE